MKKLVLGGAVAVSLVAVMAGQSSATALQDMNQAIADAEAMIAKVENSGLKDAKGVSLQYHVDYLRSKVAIAREAVLIDYAKYPEELYATVTEGTRALELISGMAKATATQTVAPKAAAQTAQPQVQTQQAQVQPKTETEEMAKVTEVSQKANTLQASKAKLAVAKIETGVLKNGAKLVDAEVSTEVAEPTDMMGPKVSEAPEDMSSSEVEVADPAETAGLEQVMEVPATGEVSTGELEKLLMAIGVATAAGMLLLAGLCALVGRR